MKTKEELDALKQEVEALNAKLAALSEDELAQVAGGNTGGDGENPSLWNHGICCKTSTSTFASAASDGVVWLDP